MNLLEIARAYVGAGLNVIPIKADGTKKPPIPWKEFHTRMATDAELVRWFGDRPGSVGIAILGGAISGGLEILDFDDGAIWERWRALVDVQFPGLLEHTPRVRTPGGGVHLYYRVRQPRGNTKLARDENGETLIETRGEGGYVLAPGCPAACHPAGKLYLREGVVSILGPPFLGGPLAELAEEVEPVFVSADALEGSLP